MADENLKIKSDYRVGKEQKDLEVYNRFEQLMATDGAQILQVNKIIISEFDFVNSPTTIWNIRKRVAERLQRQAEKEAQEN